MAAAWASTPARRETILAAALELFTTKGYEATSIDEVRRAAGASTGSIYHHFANKQALAAALFVEILAEYQEQMLEVLGTHEHAREGVPAAVRHYLSWVERNPAKARFLLTTREPDVRAASTPAVQELNKRYLSESAEWRRRNVERGELLGTPGDVWTATLFGPAQSFARLWLAGRTTTPIADAAERFATDAWNAVRADGAQE